MKSSGIILLVFIFGIFISLKGCSDKVKKDFYVPDTRTEIEEILDKKEKENQLNDIQNQLNKTQSKLDSLNKGK